MLRGDGQPPPRKAQPGNDPRRGLSKASLAPCSCPDCFRQQRSCSLCLFVSLVIFDEPFRPQIREGMTVLSPVPESSSDFTKDRSILLSIFSAVGRCRFLDEKHFDACTALAGSGPAFACVFLEAMADGGVMMGLPRAEALELAAQS